MERLESVTGSDWASGTKTGIQSTDYVILRMIPIHAGGEVAGGGSVRWDEERPAFGRGPGGGRRAPAPPADVREREAS